MAITRPFRRTCRQLADGSYANAGNGAYVGHRDFATSPKHYQRAFKVLQKDFIALLDYIEPASENRSCYSYRTHELLMRACIEVEANCKAIFSDNDYLPGRRLSMSDYKKLDLSHRLSAYQVKLPTWSGPDEHAIRAPFGPWAVNGSLSWYSFAYNQSKHSRHEHFHLANFEAVVDAMCGLAALISAQFMNEDFSPASFFVADGVTEDGYQACLGDYFLVKYPDLPPNERYSFDWRNLKNSNDPFHKFDFERI